MIFELDNYIIGFPVNINRFVTSHYVYYTGQSIILGSCFENILLITGLTLIVGFGFSLPAYIDRKTYFQAMYGILASQDINNLIIKKIDLLGVTSKTVNSPTALLLGLINNLLTSFPTSVSVPIEAYIFSRYEKGDYEYVDIVIKCKAKLTVLDTYEIQYFDNSFEPDNFN